MSHEIEAKIKVPVLGPIADKLKELGATPLHEVRQVDTYFMDLHKLLHKNDCGLRIRQETIGAHQTAMITFKGARSQSQYKSRPEFETGITDVEAMEKIFESLGFAKRLTLEKKRSIWQTDSCHVCLDELPRLGYFVEVEGPTEDIIFSVLEKLDLQNEPHISRGYASLMEHELKLEGTEQTEVFLK